MKTSSNIESNLISKWEPSNIQFEEKKKLIVERLDIEDYDQLIFMNQYKLRGELLLRFDSPDLISLVLNHQNKNVGSAINMSNSLVQMNPRDEMIKRLRKNEAQPEGKYQLEYFGDLKSHVCPIKALEFLHSFSLLISVDAEGFLIIWDYEKKRIHKKIAIIHFTEKQIFDKATSEFEFPPIKKSLLQREKIICLKICEENGDFLVQSKNYLSVYSINGVLISCIHRKNLKLSKFSTCLIVNVRE